VSILPNNYSYGIHEILRLKTETSTKRSKNISETVSRHRHSKLILHRRRLSFSFRKNFMFYKYMSPRFSNHNFWLRHWKRHKTVPATSLYAVFTYQCRYQLHDWRNLSNNKANNRLRSTTESHLVQPETSEKYFTLHYIESLYYHFAALYWTAVTASK